MVAKPYIATFYPTSLQQIIKAYAYTQYQDDDDVLAFFIALNAMLQDELDFLNTLNLPVYTTPLIAGTLLDWVGQGLYNIARPVVGVGAKRLVGPYNTWAFNTIPFNGRDEVGNIAYALLTDDLYKRVLTWHHYRGDGRQFTIPWLKRRIARFLQGSAGTDADLTQLNTVGIVISGSNFTITPTIGTYQQPLLQTLQGLLVSKQLELPFQYTYSLVI